MTQSRDGASEAPRSGPGGLGPEKPREVFREACEALAARLLLEGFVSRRHGQELVRWRGPWRHSIGFSSSHHNRAGVGVAIWANVIVSNGDLARWRRLSGGPANDLVVGRMLHRLDPAIPIDWDLVDPARRDAVRKEITSSLLGVALPWFELFADRAAFVTGWLPDTLLELHALVELLVFLGRTDDAVRVVGDTLVRERWTGPFVDDDPLVSLRDLATRHSLDLPLPAPGDPAFREATVARLRDGLAAYSHTSGVDRETARAQFGWPPDHRQPRGEGT